MLYAILGNTFEHYQQNGHRVCISDCATQMLQNLFLQEGSLVSIKNATLPKASFVKLRPQSIDFLDLSNPKAV